MQGGVIQGATRIVGKSQGYLGLAIRDETVNCTVNGPDTPAMVTAWLPTPAELIRRGLPENLQPVDVFYDPTAFRLWMEEGIPVAYVLDGRIVNDLAAATRPQERRAILGRRRELVPLDL